MARIPEKLYFKIGEAAKITRVKPHVLRYWEAEFKIISPKKSLTKQRVYTRRDVEAILEIKRLLYKEKYTLEGAKKKLREVKTGAGDQMKFPFNEELYQNTLKSIKKDLQSIKEALG
ncbi:MAG: MerR family transcriptional regulator [Deltaproteobacteria bacterium]|nr:MerR family transcriptional regulator [Deltaproteobacteria bacterium]